MPGSGEVGGREELDIRGFREELGVECLSPALFSLVLRWMESAKPFRTWGSELWRWGMRTRRWMALTFSSPVRLGCPSLELGTGKQGLGEPAISDLVSNSFPPALKPLRPAWTQAGSFS